MPALTLQNITKRFGEVIANNDVSLSVEEGEILALLGENGSGKTTLMNMLSGIYRPDGGTIRLRGAPVSLRSPEDAKRLGIGMVHQHFKLVENFTVADNILMGAEHAPVWLRKSRIKKLQTVIDRFGFSLSPTKKIYDMSVSEKQTAEIVKVLYYGAKILILDEPTAVLTTQEIAKLFATLKEMKRSGHTIIIITHKLNEVMEVSDRVAVMRKGQYIKTVRTASTTPEALTELMVGQKVDLKIERTQTAFDLPLLEIRNLSVLSDERATAIDGVSFYIRGGEMLGVAGISGCGQKELCEAIAGLRPVQGGDIVHKGASILGLSPDAIIAKGVSMSFIPEDRLGMGLAPSLSIADNVILKTYRGGNRFNPFVNRKAAREKARAIVERLQVVTPSIDTPVRVLSGGNVQKVLVGREIQAGPNVIVTAYPVRGLDINSSYTIYNILNEQKAQGVGILFIGEDIDVIMALCDKIMVLCKGKVMGIVHADKVTKEELGLMMTGALDLHQIKPDKRFGLASDSLIEGERKV